MLQTFTKAQQKQQSIKIFKRTIQTLYVELWYTSKHYTKSTTYIKLFFSEGIKYKLNYTISKISLQRCLHIHVEMSSFYSTCICNLLVSQWLFSYVLDVQIYIKQKYKKKK